MKLKSRMHSVVTGAAVLLAAGGAVLLGASSASAANGVSMNVAVTSQSVVGSACNWTVTFNVTFQTSTSSGPVTVNSVSAGSYGALANNGGLTAGTVLKKGTSTYTGLTADDGPAEGQPCPTEAPAPLVFTVVTSASTLTWNESVSDPQVVTMMALPQGSTGATLAGSFDVANCTQYYFQYGTTTAYGQQTTPAVTDCPNDGTATEIYGFNATGLLSGTTYHYRAVVVQSNGTPLYGQDVQFHTGGTALPVGAVGLIGVAAVAGTALFLNQRRRRRSA